MIKSLPHNCILVIFFIFIVVTTIVSCFWSIYLLEAIRRKWRIYRHALQCLQKGECDLQQKILAYNSETEFVKIVFLFFMNLVEYTGLTFAFLSYVTIYINHIYTASHKDRFISMLGHSIYLEFPTNNNETLFSQLLISQSFPYLDNISIVLGTVLIASLFKYLAARYAQKSWIKSDKIPSMIGVFLIYEIIIQILVSFCNIHLIAMWCDKIIITAALLIAFQEYRKLIMVINWLIVDLKVCKNSTLLQKQVRMKHNFTQLIRLFSIGCVILLMSEYFNTIAYSLIIIFRENEYSDFSKYVSFCEVSHFSNSDIPFIFIILSMAGDILTIIGISFIFIPYIGHGFFTMCTILWRLWKGKTGYKTHYRNPLLTPLIRNKKYTREQY